MKKWLVMVLVAVAAITTVVFVTTRDTRAASSESYYHAQQIVSGYKAYITDSAEASLTQAIADRLDYIQQNEWQKIANAKSLANQLQSVLNQ